MGRCARSGASYRAMDPRSVTVTCTGQLAASLCLQHFCFRAEITGGCRGNSEDSLGKGPRSPPVGDQTAETAVSKELRFPHESHTGRRKRLGPWCQTEKELVS